MAYKPFGEKLNLDKDGKTTTKASHTNRGYTGHEHIEETNLINMNARLYDPTIARFISADSIIPYMYDTQSFNRYSYVRNNPLKYIDPSGHFSLSSFVKSVGGALSQGAKDTGGGLSTTFKDTGGSIAYNKYNIYGVVLIVVGIVVIAASDGLSEIGGIGGGLIAAGIGMLKYKPDEEESQQNQIYIGTGGSSGVSDFTVVEWGGGSQSQSEQEQYIVNNVSQGTHSVTTGNKFNNGADTNSFIVTIGDYSNVNDFGALHIDYAEMTSMYRGEYNNNSSILGQMKEGDIVFAKRALGGYVNIPFTGFDPWNTEGVHEHIFFGKGGKNSIGYFGDNKGVSFTKMNPQTVSRYTFSKVYHVNNLNKSFFNSSRFNSLNYDLLNNNCQDYSDHIAAKIRWEQGH